MTDIRGMVETALREVLASRTEWDEPPELYYIVRDRRADHVHARGLPFPDVVWGIMEPTELLHRMGAVALEHGVPALAIDGAEFEYVGAAFRYEAWGVHQDPYDLITELAAEERQLHLHPDRREGRVINAAIPEGTVSVIEDRVTGNVEVVHVGDGYETEGGGRVTTALTRILFALRGGLHFDPATGGVPGA